jgi:hypothetical protein
MPWDTATGTLCGTLECYSDAVLAVAFSLNGRLVASGSRDMSVRHDGNGNADWRLWYEDTNGLGSSLGQNVE